MNLNLLPPSHLSTGLLLYLFHKKPQTQQRWPPTRPKRHTEQLTQAEGRGIRAGRSSNGNICHSARNRRHPKLHSKLKEFKALLISSQKLLSSHMTHMIFLRLITFWQFRQVLSPKSFFINNVLSFNQVTWLASALHSEGRRQLGETDTKSYNFVRVRCVLRAICMPNFRCDKNNSTSTSSCFLYMFFGCRYSRYILFVGFLNAIWQLFTPRVNII